jgi:SAM-dependent methyltransferase
MTDIDRIQFEHRLKLIEFWGIAQNDRVFEIGCGQGDTTVALASVVGENGVVYGIDIASPEYGEPETLGQARERILNSDVGNRVQIHFNFDLLNRETSFIENEFDYAVLSHCLWYLSSYDDLVRLLATARGFCKKLCIAEWNPNINLPEQLPHYKAVVIQAICESFVASDFSNVRTMFYPADIERAVKESGWAIERTGTVYSEDIQDGSWEVSMVNEFYKNRINTISSMPPKLKALLNSQIDELYNAECIKPMSAFCLVAT